MLTKGIYDVDISSSFNAATSAISQRIKPLLIIDWLDSRHVDKSGNTEIASSNFTSTAKTSQNIIDNCNGLLANNRSLSSKEIFFNKARQKDFYFTPNESINGIERQTFTWGVCDAKDKNGKTITANGQWHCMPTTKEENYEFGYESSVKSTSNLHATLNGYELTSPVILTYIFQERKVNLIKIVTSEYNGQIYAYNIKAYNNTNTLVYNEDGEIPKNSYYFNHYLDGVNNDINKILLTVYTTKNPLDHVRINEVAPIYRKDITDYVVGFNAAKTRDVHETSLPISGGGSNTASIDLDNSNKDFNIFNSASLYGKYMKKDLRCQIYIGYEKTQYESDTVTSSLSSNISSSSNTIPVYNINDFPQGGSGDDYIITVNSNTINQEKILVRKGLGHSFNVITRGVGDTKARSHTSGSSVIYDIFEYIPVGVFYVDEWSGSSSSMMVKANLIDAGKFSKEKMITKGFIIQESTVGKAVEQLLMMSNFPKKDIKYLKKPYDFYCQNGKVLHLNFDEKDVDRANNERKVSSSLRARLFKVPDTDLNSARDILLDANDKYLSSYEKALGLRAPVSPSLTTTTKEISDQSGASKALNFISGQFVSKNNETVISYFNGIFDGFYVPSNSGNQRLIIGLNNGGVRVYLNNVKIIDKWLNLDTGTNTPQNISSSLYNLTAGKVYDLRIEFFTELNTANEPFKIFLKKEYNSVIDWVYSSECYNIVGIDSAGARSVGSYLTFSANSWSVSSNVNPIERSGTRNNAILLGNVNISEPSGIISDLENRSILLESNSYVRVPYDISFDIFNSNNANYTGDFTIELYGKFHNGSFSNDGEYLSSFNNSSPTNGFEFYSNSSSNGFKFITSNGVQNISSNVALSNSAFSLITVTYSDNVLKYYINGDLKNTVSTSGSLTPFTDKDITIGGRGASFSSGTESLPVTIRSFYIDEFAILNNALTEDLVKENYIQTQIQPIEVLPFIYGNDSTIESIINDISVADFGRLYYDENNKARYEHYYRFFESSIDQHSNVQYTFSDSSNIIDADYNVQLQTNKVVVKVNKISKPDSSLQALWSAERTSVAVTNLTTSMSNSDVSINVKSTNEPFFGKSGYLKIDDEIIKYSNITSNTFTTLERGQFDTEALSHNSNALVREVKVYDKLSFDKSPAYMIRSPLITNITDKKPPRLELIKFDPTPYGAFMIIAASSTNVSGDIIYLEGDDKENNESHFTRISGIPVTLSDNNGDVKEQKNTLDDNIRKYGLKELIIENEYITDLDYAKRLANFIISKMSEPVPIINISILPVVKLQLGDRIRISTLDSFDIINGDYWIINSDISFGKTLEQKLTIRKVV